MEKICTKWRLCTLSEESVEKKRENNWEIGRERGEKTGVSWGIY